MSLTDFERAELARIYAEDDRLRAEHADWMAREAKRQALMRKSDPSGNALVHAPEPEPEPSYEEPEDFNASQRDMLARIIKEASHDLHSELMQEMMQEIEHLEQKLLQTVHKMVLPGETAELQVRTLGDRVSIVEGRIERQLSATTVARNAEDDVIPNWRQKN
jgi:hypothetical protein